MFTLLIIGVITAFNMLVLKWKVSNGRYADAALDVVALSILSIFFGHTLGGMVVAMVSSLIISLYLLAFPPVFARA